MASEEMLKLNPFLGLCLGKEKEAREKQTTLFNYLHSEYFYSEQNHSKMNIRGSLDVENVASKSRDGN